jgi:serine/threonine-protein kinase
MDEIAHGGMGIVYRARDVTFHRTVALKLMLGGQLADEQEVKRFRAEAEATARLDHPNIVPVYEVGEQDGWPYFSMKLMEGGSLKERLATSAGPMEPREAAIVVGKVARAVHHAHQRSILHRDLKPANILLDARGEPQVSDFGLALCLDSAEDLTANEPQLGSPSYMAPEQVTGRSEQLSPATDVYGLGALLYHLLTGRPPFEAATPQTTVERVLHREPPPPRALRPEIPLTLETISLKCLEKDPRRRYASADALAEELEGWVRSEAIPAIGAGKTGPSKKGFRP